MDKKSGLDPKLRRNNAILAIGLGIFAIGMAVYSMRYIWPYVDIFK